MEALKFNPLVTIKLINKENVLKDVFVSMTGPYNYATLTKEAETNSLSKEKTETLVKIFDGIIVPKAIYASQYEHISLAKKKDRRYGKVMIDADIKTQDGVATELQKTMLVLNELKSMWLNLDGKGVSDHYRGTSKLSSSDMRTIMSAVLTFKKKTEKVRNSKK